VSGPLCYSADDAFDLGGRRALVTGASRGIGRAIAVGLAALGADVVALARSTDGLAETVAASARKRGTVSAHSADLSNPDSIERCVEATAESLGGIDILVNNAGTAHASYVEDTDLSTWERVVDLNLRTCWLLARAASPHLHAGDGGKLINVASVLGLVGSRGESAYVAAKHGLIGLTRALALEWAQHNVQVNALAPGYVETEMTRGMLEDDELARSVVKNTPIGRWGQTDEIVGPAVFLASRASSFVTGQVLVVDGGWTAQ